LHRLYLQTILETAVEEPILRCIRCIDRGWWVYVDHNQDKSRGQKIRDFEAALDKASPDTLLWMKEHFVVLCRQIAFAMLSC